MTKHIGINHIKVVGSTVQSSKSLLLLCPFVLPAAERAQ